jgi:MFS family permease
MQFLNSKDMNFSNEFVFIICTLINLLNFIDRGIIPGSTIEFNDFISLTTGSKKPDILLGLLQSSFIIGLLIGAVLFGHLIHYYERFLLSKIGCFLWLIAIFFSGIAFYVESYYFLLIFRMISGFGEACLLCTIPPWIQLNASPSRKGLWLSAFYTAVPVGTALGYAYSSLMTNSFGWQFAFFGEAIISLPLLFYLSQFKDIKFVSRHHKLEAEITNQSSMVSHSSSSSDQHLSPSVRKESTSNPSILQEFLIVCRNPICLCFIFGSAASTAVLIGLSTFGSAFVMGLGYFDLESEASSMFGILISIAGIIATPLGGYSIDKTLQIMYGNTHHASSGPTVDSKKTKYQLLSKGSAKTNNPLRINPSMEEEEGEGIEMVLAEEEIHQIIEEEKSQSLPVLKPSQIIEVISYYCYWFSLVGTILFCCLYFIMNKSLFLTCLTFGCFFLFYTNTGISMATMISVPEENQPFAIALASLFGHLFGDVPSPIFTGWLKDTLAPNCISSSSSDGGSDNVAASPACREQSDGLRMCIFIISVWLYWSVICFGIVMYLIKKQR